MGAPFIDPGVDGVLSSTLVGNAVTVTLARTAGALSTTADDLIAFLSVEPAQAVVQVSGTGLNILTALPITHLSGAVLPIMTSNAMNMSMTQTSNGVYTIQLEDEFPELLSAQVTLLQANPDSNPAKIKSADTAFGTSKTVVIFLPGGTLALNDGMFVHLVLRNSSNP